jgi:hypothetical protein
MSILVFWVCACPWARKLLYRMRARVALGIACRLDTYLSANRPYHAYIAGARLDWRASIRWTAKAAMRHLPDLHMERIALGVWDLRGKSLHQKGPCSYLLADKCGCLQAPVIGFACHYSDKDTTRDTLWRASFASA